MIDAIKAGGGEVTFGPRDGKAVKDSGADAQLIADAYLAVWRGEWGDGWLRENLSIRLVVERLGGYQAWLKDRRPAVPQAASLSRIAPAAPADVEVWRRAVEAMRGDLNAANFETYIAPLAVAGRGPDGGLRLVCDAGLGEMLAKFRRLIVRALMDAGDDAPKAVGFVSRKREEGDAE